MISKKKQVEFGDFQTPQNLADTVCQLLSQMQIQPATVIEPTCGVGNFVFAAVNQFPTLTQIYANEINATYLTHLQNRLKHSHITINHADFFSVDWHDVTHAFDEPLLFIGNPPWVTNSALSVIDGANLPIKHNFQQLHGIDAITGASNFDISEWMILKMVDVAHARHGIVAMLCKTSVARKILLQIWKNERHYGVPTLFQFDAKEAFDVSVDACLFVYDASQCAAEPTCQVYQSLSTESAFSTIGYDQQQLIANIELFKRWQHLRITAKDSAYVWRSGIKHDCARVMELHQDNGHYINKDGKICELEETYLYPMLKSSDLAGNRKRDNLWMLVTQHAVGDLTHPIKSIAPKTWQYLTTYSNFLDARKSSIYKGRPRFSIFGVGDYSFKMWKVAISGLYKSLQFQVVPPKNGKPTVLDDTCYFLACASEQEARLLAEMLNAESSQQFWQSLIFWDAKRPITAKLLRQLDIWALAKELDKLDELNRIRQASYSMNEGVQQLQLFEQSEIHET